MHSQKVLEILKRSKRPMSLSRISKRLGVGYKDVRMAIRQLMAEGFVEKADGDTYAASTPKSLSGKLVVNRFGKVTVVSEAGRSFIVPVAHRKGARHGDIVTFELAESDEGGRQRYQGHITEIVERANEVLVGTAQNVSDGVIVNSLDKRLGSTLIKAPKGGIVDGDMVAVRLSDSVVTTETEHGERTVAAGELQEVLGSEGQAAAFLKSIAVMHHIPLTFPQGVTRAANSLAQPDAEEIGAREDLRELLTFTIDGQYAKDLDDAVSLERIPGGYRLGVHIADVSHYVKPNSAIDREAFARGNSTYLPGLTIPMLPERLSNDLCSLWPHTDKLTMSCFVDLDEDARPIAKRVTSSVIRSAARLTYDEVFEVIKGGEGGNAAPYRDKLLEMEKLRQKLYANRIAGGSMDFEVGESYFKEGDDGWPVSIERRDANAATRLIEEFMLSANVAVAEISTENKLPAVFRIHPLPDSEKIEDMWAFLNTLGYSGAGASPFELQRVVRESKGTPEESIVSGAILRSMQKAVYSVEDTGHYGLGFDHYCHFTSPIRRYSDLQTHRALKKYLSGSVPRKTEKLLALANQCTEREIMSMFAERESHDLFRAYFMQGRVGDEVKGVISGVTEFGFFAELDNTVEGLVHISALGDDYYNYDQKSRQLVGQRTRKRYKLGMEVDLIVAAAKLSPPQVDFALASQASKRR